MARDFFHPHVRLALEKDGWTITHDPFRIEFEGDEYEADLGAERLIGAEKGAEKIVVEIKSFLGASMVYQFHDALGKYLNYVVGLKITGEGGRVLFLAISKQTYFRLSESPLLMASVKTYKVNLLIFDSTQQAIIQWIRL